MSSTKKTLLDTGGSNWVVAVAFHPDRMHLLGGGSDGIHRWRLSDGQEVGRQTGIELRAISVSRDHNWVVCGTTNGACVWDATLRQKVTEVERTEYVAAVDVAPDGRRFASGTALGEKRTSIWDIKTGARLVGPLLHESYVTGTRFSPDGRHIATVYYGGSIRVFDSRTGHELVKIENAIPSLPPITPIAWSNDGHQLFAASNNSKIKSFEVSTRSQLAESRILNSGDDNGNVESIALATNGTFIATYSDYTISLLHASTLIRSDEFIRDDERIGSIALSSDDSYIATGRSDGKISIHSLGHISWHFRDPPQQDSVREEPQRDEVHNRANSVDLLLFEAEASPSTPSPQFDYNDPPSLTSCADLREDDAQSVSATYTVQQPENAQPTASPEEIPKEILKPPISSQSKSMLEGLLAMWIGKSSKGSVSNNPGRAPVELHQPIDRQPRPKPPARVEAVDGGPVWIVAGKRKKRTVVRSLLPPRREVKVGIPDFLHGSGRGRVAAEPIEPDPAPRTNNLSQRTPSRVYISDQRETGEAVISIRLPAWMLCRASGTGDGTHGSR